MSSIARVTPQFLGQLCLVINTSRVDQQLIHYIQCVMEMVIFKQRKHIWYKKQRTTKQNLACEAIEISCMPLQT